MSGSYSNKGADGAMEMTEESEVHHSAVVMNSPTDGDSHDANDPLLEYFSKSHVGIDEESYYALSPHISLEFKDVFREPKDYMGTMFGDILAPGMQKVFGLIFLYSQMILYYMLSLFTGVFLGVAWGLAFGALNYVVVWFVQPAIKICFIAIRIAVVPVRAITRALCDPCFQSVGQMLTYFMGRIRIHVTLRSSRYCPITISFTCVNLQSKPALHDCN